MNTLTKGRFLIVVILALLVAILPGTGSAEGQGRMVDLGIPYNGGWNLGVPVGIRINDNQQILAFDVLREPNGQKVELPLVGHAINNEGKVVGYKTDENEVVWDRASGQFTPLQYVGGGKAIAINDPGLVAGFIYQGSAQQYAARWNADGTCPPSPDPIGCRIAFGPESIAYDININGQVVGRDKNGRAFLFEDGQKIDLGTLGGDFSAAMAINDNGQVVGRSETATGEQHAVLWENGQITELPTLGGDFCAAIDINNHGQVAGWCTTASGEFHASLWEGGLPFDLGTLGGNKSAATAINNHGQVVGWSETASGGSSIFLWTKNMSPVCNDASPSQALIWPANHKFVPIEVFGVTDPDGDPISITIDSIFQDEAVDAPGSGNTSPDGQGVGTSTAGVRAERVGKGNGRVYHISFTADDGRGGTCSSEVLVGVPHDKKDDPVDDGPLYNSTVAP